MRDVMPAVEPLCRDCKGERLEQQQRSLPASRPVLATNRLARKRNKGVEVGESWSERPYMNHSSSLLYHAINRSIFDDILDKCAISVERVIWLLSRITMLRIPYINTGGCPLDGPSTLRTRTWHRTIERAKARREPRAYLAHLHIQQNGAIGNGMKRTDVTIKCEK